MKTFVRFFLCLSIFLFCSNPVFAQIDIGIDIPYTDHPMNVSDGLGADWEAAGLEPVLTDPIGDSTCGEGTDLTKLYMAQDSEFLYWRMDIAGDNFDYLAEEVTECADTAQGPIVVFYSATDGEIHKGVTEVNLGTPDSAYISTRDTNPDWVGYIGGIEYGFTNEIAEGKIPLSLFNEYNFNNFLGYYYCSCDEFEISPQTITQPPSDLAPNFTYAGIYNETLPDYNDTTGQSVTQRVALLAGIDGSSRFGDLDTLGNLTVQVTGPNFSYQFTDNDLDQDGTLDLWTTQSDLESGLYTFTVSDQTGNSVSQKALRADPKPIPLVDSSTIQTRSNDDGTTTITWAPLAEPVTYWYRIWLRDASGQTVYSTEPDMNTWLTIPVGILQSGENYRVQVRAQDGPHVDLAFNRSRSNEIEFVCNGEATTGVIPYPVIFHNNYTGLRTVIVYIESLNQMGIDDFGQLEFLHVTGPNNYFYSFTAEDFYETYIAHWFPVGASETPTIPGMYTFHARVDGKDYYGYDSLTPAQPLPLPDTSTFQAKNLGDGNIRFSWGDGEYNGATYYRVRIMDNNTGNIYKTSHIRFNERHVDIPLSSIEALGTSDKFMLVEAYDSARWTTMRNRVKTEWVPFDISPYEMKLTANIADDSFNNGPVVSRIWGQVGIPDEDLATFDVIGPDGSVDLLNQGSLLVYDDAPSYIYFQNRAATPGLYKFTANDTTGHTKVHYDYQPTTHKIPSVNYRTVHIDSLQNGDLRFSWAPVEHDVPLWYSLRIWTVADHNGDGKRDQVEFIYDLTRTSTTVPASSLPDEPLVFHIWARDGSNWETANNRSSSLFVEYRGPGFDYSTLVDPDGDGVANVVGELPTDSDGDGIADSADNCPYASNPDQSDFDQDGIGDVCDISSPPLFLKQHSIGLGTSNGFAFSKSFKSDIYYDQTYSVPSGLQSIRFIGANLPVSGEGTWTLEPDGTWQAISGENVSDGYAWLGGVVYAGLNNSNVRYIGANITAGAGGYSNASLNDDWYVVNMVLADWGAYSLIGTVSFDGAGGGSLVATGSESGVGSFPETGTASYQVATDGTFSLTVPGPSTLIGGLNSTSDRFVLAGVGDVTTQQIIYGIKKGTASYTNASLDGTYYLTTMNASSDGISAEYMVLSADGSGGFTANVTYNNLSGAMQTENRSGTYSVNPDGTLNLSYADEVTNCALSGDLESIICARVNSADVQNISIGVKEKIVNEPPVCTLTYSQNAVPQSLPTDFNILGDISAIDSSCPGVTDLICLDYDDNNLPGSESDVRLIREDGEHWRDITFSLDRQTNKVCGQTNEFTLFAVALPVATEEQPHVEIPIYSGDSSVYFSGTSGLPGTINLPEPIPVDCVLSFSNLIAPPPPEGYRLIDGNAVDIDFPCATGPVEVCLSYDETKVLGAESDLRIFHRDSTLGWQDVTDLTTIDTNENKVCGTVSSFSPFGVAEPMSPLLVLDSDGDGLLDTEELAIGTDPYETDTDNDGTGDGEDIDPVNWTAHTSWAGVWHTTKIDGSHADYIGFGVNGTTADYVGLSAVVTGPEGFIYDFQGSVGSVAFPQLKEGVYTLTITDSQGHKSVRTDRHANPKVLPFVDHKNISYKKMVDGSYRFSWPIVNDPTTYAYRLRIETQGGNYVYQGWRTQKNEFDVPAGFLVSGVSYRAMVQVHDSTSFDLLFNRSDSDWQYFVADDTDYNVNNVILRGNIYNFSDSSGNYTVPTLTVTDPSGITFAEVSGPEGFNHVYYGSPSEVIPYGFSSQVYEFYTTADPELTQAGLYTYHIKANGQDFYYHSTLTPAEPLSLPDSSTYQAQELADGKIRFSWSDIDQNGLLYYRIKIRNKETYASYYTDRINSLYVDLDPNTIAGRIGSDPGLWEWRVAVSDSAYYSTYRNRANGSYQAYDLVAYDPDSLLINPGSRPSHRIEYDKTSNFRLGFYFQDDVSMENIETLNVIDPDNQSTNIKEEGVPYRGPGYFGFYKIDAGEPQVGLYTFIATSLSGRQSVLYNYQPAAKQIDPVDHKTFQVSREPNGDLRLSWAPVYADFPIIYNFRLSTLADYKNASFYELWNLKNTSVVIPASSIPDEPVVIKVLARDGGGTTQNNRSHSVWVGFEGPDFAYSSLVDADGDGLASNIDPDDLLMTDLDGDGLTYAEELNLGTDPNNDDTDGDGLPDGSDSAPLSIRANIEYAGIYNETLPSWSDPQDIAERVAFAIGIQGKGQSLGDLNVVMTGPEGLLYQFNDSDIDVTGDRIELWKTGTSYPPGLYTFTVTDAEGNSVSQAELHKSANPIDLVNSDTIQIVSNSDETTTISWAQLDDPFTYWYRIRVYDANGGLAYSTRPSMSNRLWIPAGTFVDGETYFVQVRAQDGPGINTAFNRSRTAKVPFVAGTGSVKGEIPYPKVYHRVEGDGTYYPTLYLEDLGRMGVNSFSDFELLEVTGPNNYRYIFTESDFHGYYIMHRFAATEESAPTAVGLYTFHAVINGQNYYGYDSLTPHNPLPVSDIETFQTEEIGENKVRFSWADGEYNGATYYRLRIRNSSWNYYKTGRYNTKYFDVDKNMLIEKLGTGDLLWRIEAYDSDSWFSIRNRSDSSYAPVNIKPYDAQYIDLLAHLTDYNYATDSVHSSFYTQPITPAGDLTAINVMGPDGVAIDILNEGKLLYYDDNPGYFYLQDQAAVPGLYSITASDSTGRSAVVYDYQPAPHAVPQVDSQGIHVDRLGNGDFRFSWAGLAHDTQLWYVLEIYSLIDANQDGQRDEVYYSGNLTSPQTIVPASVFTDEHLIFRIKAQDGSTGLTGNNRSYTAYFGYEGCDYNYASLVDLDGDHWSNNVDKNDENLYIYPFSDADNDGISIDYDQCPTENASGFDADQNGCIDNTSGLLVVLNTLLDEEVIDPTMSNSVFTQVENAQNSIEKDKVCTAINQLGAFNSHIAAQTGKKVSFDASEDLINYSNSVINSLITSLPDGETCN